MESTVINIVEELKIINLVLELIPINAELKKNLNLHAIALNLKPRLNKIAHNMATSDLESDGRCECLQKGYEAGLCRKRSVCEKIEKPHHTEKCWKNLTTNYGGYLCTCENTHDIVDGDLKEKEPAKQEKPELFPVGARVKITGGCHINCIGKFGTIASNTILINQYVIKLDKAVIGFQNPIYVMHSGVEKLEDSKPEWQPKFKVDDWIVYKNPSNLLLKINLIDFKNEKYLTEYFDGTPAFKVTELNIKLWQPMQELKNQLATAKEEINKLKDHCDFLETIRANQANAISKLFKTKQELEEQLAAKDQLLKRVDGNSYSTVIDRIARGEFKLKHKWVELSEFVNSNPEWVHDNFKFIIAQAILFHKKGDLINYNYDIKNNKFIFDYALGITKLMMPLSGFEE